MKVLLINKFHYLKGGSERVYLETKKLLEENGHDVVCFSMKHKKNIESDQKNYFVDFVNFTSRKNWLKKAIRYIYYSEAAKRLELLIKKEKPDVAHLHNIAHQISPSILKALKKYKIPVVQTLHDYQIICPNYSLYTKGNVCERCQQRKYFHCVVNKCVQDSFFASLLAALELYLQWIFGFYRKKVDLFLAPSKFLKERVEDWGVKQRIELHHNFVDLERFVPNYNVGQNVVCVSRLGKEKGIMTLVKAIRKMPELKLKLIGDGPQRKIIEKYIQEKQIKNVKVMGARFGDEMFAHIREAKFCVVPSNVYENYPLVVLESMALGKPVLAARTGGLKEMVTENYNGWFFEAGSIRDLREKLRRINNSVKNIEQLGRNARTTVEQFNSKEYYYKNLMRYYNLIVKKDTPTDLG